MAEQKRRTRTNIFQTLIETQSSDEQLDLGVVDSDNDPEYECEGSGSSESESEVVASTSRSNVRPRSRVTKSKTTKTPHFLKNHLKKFLKIFNSNKKHYTALSFQYIILNYWVDWTIFEFFVIFQKYPKNASIQGIWQCSGPSVKWVKISTT